MTHMVTIKKKQRHELHKTDETRKTKIDLQVGSV